MQGLRSPTGRHILAHRHIRLRQVRAASMRERRWCRIRPLDIPIALPRRTVRQSTGAARMPAAPDMGMATPSRPLLTASRPVRRPAMRWAGAAMGRVRWFRPAAMVPRATIPRLAAVDTAEEHRTRCTRAGDTVAEAVARRFSGACGDRFLPSVCRDNASAHTESRTTGPRGSGNPNAALAIIEV